MGLAKCWANTKASARTQSSVSSGVTHVSRETTPCAINASTSWAFVGIVVLPVGLLAWHSQATGRWRTVDASDK